MQSVLAIPLVSSSPAEPVAVAKADPDGEGLLSFGDSFVAPEPGEGVSTNLGDVSGAPMPVAVWTGAAMSAAPLLMVRAGDTELEQTGDVSDQARRIAGEDGVIPSPVPTEDGATEGPGPKALVSAGTDDEEKTKEIVIRLAFVANTMPWPAEAPDRRWSWTGEDSRDEARAEPKAGSRIELRSPADAPGTVGTNGLDSGNPALGGVIPLDVTPAPGPTLREDLGKISPIVGPRTDASLLAETIPSGQPRELGADADVIASAIGSRNGGGGDVIEAEDGTDRVARSGEGQAVSVAPIAEKVVVSIEGGPTPNVGEGTAVLAIELKTEAAVALPGASSGRPTDTVGLQTGLPEVKGTAAEPPNVRQLPHGPAPGFWERFFTITPEWVDFADLSEPTPALISQLQEKLAAADGREAQAGIEVGLKTVPLDPNGKREQREQSRNVEMLLAVASSPVANRPAQAVPSQPTAQKAAGTTGLPGQILLSDEEAQPVDLSSLMSVGAPGGVLSTALAGPATTPSAPLSAGVAVPHFAQQITSALSRSADGATEFALSPDELGNVRLRLEPDAANPDRMVVMITFERPETLDLFRRHAGELADALRSAGYAGADIGFGQEGGSFGSDRRESAADPHYDSAPAASLPGPAASAPRLMAGASLYLRL